MRARLTSGQPPSYFVGAPEHLDMRRAVEAKDGAAFEPIRYHDRCCLLYTSPSPRD